MKKITLLLSFVLVSLCFCTPCYAQSHQLADRYWDNAEQLKKQGNYEEAAEMYEKSAEAEQSSPTQRGVYLIEEFRAAGQMYQLIRRYQEAMYNFKLALLVAEQLGRDDHIAEDFSNLGGLFQSWGRYDEALENYKKALAIDKKLGRADYISRGFNNIGFVYQSRGQYDKALNYFNKALAIDKKSGREEGIVRDLINIGFVYESQGQYQIALKPFEQALAISRKLGRHDYIVACLNKTGLIYKVLGQYDTALNHFEQALAIGRKSGREDYIAGSLNSIGGIYQSRGQYNTAINHFEEALVIYRKLGMAGDIAGSLNNIGKVYTTLGKNEKALNHFEQALALSRKLGREDYIAGSLNSIGGIYHSRGQYDTAINHFEQALAMYRKLGREGDVAGSLNNIGKVYQSLGQTEKAVHHFEQALALSRKLGRDDYIAASLNSTAHVYQALGQNEKAINTFEQALAIYKKLGRNDSIAISFNSIGRVYQSLGQYDTAINHYQQALAINRKLGRESDIAGNLNTIGAVYQSWGQYDTALGNYEQSLAISRKLGRDDYIAGCLSSIGMIYLLREQYDKATANFEQALVIDRRLGRQADISERVNNIGGVYQSLGQYDNAMRNFEQALTIERKLGRKGLIARSLNNIGGVYQFRGQYDKALRNYEQALTIDRQLGRKAEIAIRLNNIGRVYYLLKQYDKAINNLNKSVELKEKLRKTATGSARRDYLASQIRTYQYLIYSYFEANELSSAFATIELSRAKLLGESLAKSNSEIHIPSVKQVQRNLSKETAIIVYANENLPEKIVIVITKDTLFGVKINDKNLIASIKDNDEESIRTYLKDQRGITVNTKIKTPETTVGKSRIHFAGVINYYRGLLTDPSSQMNRGLRVAKKTVLNKTKPQTINKAVYDFLIKPVEKYIHGKTTLLIIPDGSLGILPFETLVDDNGHYLIEKYNICYSQSMGVLDLIKKRKYKTGRKPLLAFGGASYNKFSYDTDMIQTEKQFEHLENKLFASFQAERSVRNAYAALDLAEWSNLPGTLNEVEKIKKLVSGASAVTGEKVTENYVKQLSARGDLTQYKVIHFATHGLVVPEVPELSAIVLSQFENELEGEDGYLRMGEIAKLKINADLVTLSACETGLGKIYSGEGVVGLNQSFLIAGANGLSVSLWQVADLSTSTFMVNMYGIVEKKKVGFDSAMNEIKRKFIRGDFGDEYRAPYYWAPFVYYGQFGGYNPN